VSGLRNIEEEYLLQAIFLAGRIGTRFSLCNTEPYDSSVLISFHVEARIRVGLPGRTYTRLRTFTTPTARHHSR
jgi:hypothetical protein